jgi:predicted RNase H-like nuclease (RuvC/YqgF family)
MKPNSKIARLKKQLKELASELDQARADKQASEATAASLQTSLDEQTETSRRLQAENEELKASQLNTTGGPEQKSADADKIESLTRDVAVLRQVRTDLLKFLRDTFVVAPGEAADDFDKSINAFDNSAEIVDDTTEQLWWCEWARDHMRYAHSVVCWELGESRDIVYWLQKNLQRQIVAGRVEIARQGRLNAALENDIAALEYDIAALEYHYARADAAVEEWQDRHVRYVQFVMETLRNENF